jgi:GNAT superfamily N-acetyltransferase
MTAEIVILPQKPESSPALAMLDTLWAEIQLRYSFIAPNAILPGDFTGPGAGFWVAYDRETPVGSIAFKPLSEDTSELDAMYVSPEYRGTGVAQQLLYALEEYTQAQGHTTMRLRAGAPQPEAIRFYEKMGFYRIPCFGRWASDDTAWCFEREL